MNNELVAAGVGYTDYGYRFDLSKHRVDINIGANDIEHRKYAMEAFCCMFYLHFISPYFVIFR